MNKIYRVRYKSGDLEIEVESSDKTYVDSKIAELLESEETPEGQPPPRPQKQTRTRKKAPPRPSTAEPEPESQVDIPALVEQIHESDDFEKLEKNVLNKRAQLPRIMMCLYYSDQLLSEPYLTTGQIETITNQLGVRIDTKNVAKVIGQTAKYFTADRVRKRGALVRNKLNRQGKKAFEKCLRGDKL